MAWKAHGHIFDEQKQIAYVASLNNEDRVARPISVHVE